MTVGYLGPDGSYSRLAAETFKKDADFKEYPNFPKLFEGLVSGGCDYIAVPIENSLNGGVLQNIDLLQNTNGIIAAEECVIQIDHRLATMEGANLGEIRRIYSHSQALAQCAGYIARNFPNAELVATASTAASLAHIKSKTEAGIVGSHVRCAGFELSPQNIADVTPNLTHFLLVQRGDVTSVKSSKKIFFSATCNHKPGELLDLLALVRSMNMTKIESRPIKGRPGEYRFFIEIEGDICSQTAIQVLKNVQNAARSFKILGCY